MNNYLKQTLKKTLASILLFFFITNTKRIYDPNKNNYEEPLQRATPGLGFPVRSIHGASPGIGFPVRSFQVAPLGIEFPETEKVCQSRSNSRANLDVCQKEVSRNEK